MADSGYLVVFYTLVFFFGVFYLFGHSLKKPPTPRLRELFLVKAMKTYAMTFVVFCANLVFSVPYSAAVNLVLLLVGIFIARDENRGKELLEQELAEAEGKTTDDFETVKAPTPFEFWTTLVLSIAACLFFSWLMASRFYRVLLDFEEQLVGALLLGIFLLGHLVYFTLCVLSSSLIGQADETTRWHDETFGEPSPRESAETLRDRLFAYRDKRDFLGIFVVLCMVGLFFHVAFSPLILDVFDRFSYRNDVKVNDFDATQSTVAAWPEGAGVVDVTVAARNFYRLENPCTVVCFPLGYTVDDENRLLWSEAAFEIMQARLREHLDRPKHPILLEGVQLGAERMAFALIRWQNHEISPYDVLKQSISMPQPDEAETFEALKNRLLQRLEEETRSPEQVAAKFGPAAASTFCRFDVKRISLFDDLGRATHEDMDQYLAERIRSQRNFIGEIVTGPNPGQPMQALLRHFDMISNEERPPLPTAPKPGEHRVHWNLEHRAVVDFHPLPDPVREPYAHVATLFAAKVLAQRLRQDIAANRAEHDGLLGFSCGIYSATHGPMLRMVTVWKPESEAADNFRSIDEMLRRQSDRLDWKALKEDRGGQAQVFAPVWVGPHYTRSGVYALLWGGSRFRYAPFLDDESQYRILARNSLWLGRRAVKNAFLEMTETKNRARILIEPEAPN